MSKLVDLAMDISAVRVAPASARRFMQDGRNVFAWIAEHMQASPIINNAPNQENFSLTFDWPHGRGMAERRLQFVFSKNRELCRMSTLRHDYNDVFARVGQSETPTLELVREGFGWLYSVGQSAVSNKPSAENAGNDSRRNGIALPPRLTQAESEGRKGIWG